MIYTARFKSESSIDLLIRVLSKQNKNILCLLPCSSFASTPSIQSMRQIKSKIVPSCPVPSRPVFKRRLDHDEPNFPALRFSRTFSIKSSPALKLLRTRGPLAT